MAFLPLVQALVVVLVHVSLQTHALAKQIIMENSVKKLHALVSTQQHLGLLHVLETVHVGHSTLALASQASMANNARLGPVVLQCGTILLFVLQTVAVSLQITASVNQVTMDHNAKIITVMVF
jgi:hypothetical protein